MEKQKEIERLKALTYTDIYYEMESVKNTITELNQALQLQQTGVSDCTHENTSFKHIRCNVCDDCGDVIEIDV
jgi:ribosomal protein S27E